MKTAEKKNGGVYMNIIENNLTFDKALSSLRKEQLQYIILHHEAAQTATVEDIHRFHKSKGWGGIAYHLYVRKDGSVYRGRPIAYRGAHTSNYNYMSVGICCEGNFENEKMSDKQYEALCDAIEYVQGVYGTALKIIGHKEVGATACPGRYFPLQEVKSKMARIKTIADVPESLKKETQELISCGALKGNGNNLDITLDMLRSIIISKRYADMKK